MTTIAEFLTAGYDEDERSARAATPGPWQEPDLTSAASDYYWGIYADEDQNVEVAAVHLPHHATADPDGQERHDAAHIARHDPARVLREVAAKRKLLTIVAEMREMDGRGFHAFADEIERALAATWSDHPDFDERRRP